MFRGHVSFRDTMMRWHDAKVSWRWEMQCIHKRWLLRMQSVNLPPKSCVRLVLCCMVYVFYAYFDCFGTSLPHLSLGWRFTWGPCSLKISGGEVNPPCSSKTQSPRARNFKCESKSLSHGIIFDSPIQPSNLKSNPLNLQYTRWALQSLQVKLLEPQNNIPTYWWGCWPPPCVL